MLTDVTHVTTLVDDVDEALEWYTERFGFETRSDETFGPGMRWVTVAPEGASTEIVLQEPNPSFHGEGRAAAMRDRIGQGTTTVLGTDDCRSDVDDLEDRGVTVTSGPEEVPWGLSAVVEDLYGNPYNLVEQR